MAKGWKTFNYYVTIEPMSFLYFTNVAMISTGWQEFLFQKFCQAENSAEDCNKASFTAIHPEYQSVTSIWVIYCNIALLIPTLVTMIFFGGFSDKHGLKLILIMPFAGGILTGVWTIINCIFFSLPVSLILISSILTGCVGFYSTVLMAASAFLVADSKRNPGSLAVRIGFLETSVSCGFLVGSLLVGPIIQLAGLTTLFAVITSINIIGLLDTMLRVRKPYQSDDAIQPPPSSFKEMMKDLFSFESARNSIHVLFRRRENSMRSHLHIVCLSFLLSYCTVVGVGDIIFLYLTKHYGHTDVFYSGLIGLRSALSMLGCSCGIPILFHKYGIRPISLSILGCITTSIYAMLQAYGWLDWLLWVSSISAIGLSYIAAGSRIYIGQNVEDDEVAAALGYFATIQAVVSLLASALFNGIYPLTLSTWPGAPFSVAAFLVISTVPLYTYVLWDDERHGLPKDS